MKRAFVSLGALLVLSTPAIAQTYTTQVNLSWNDCVLGPFAIGRANDCTTNTGTMGTLFVSFSPPGTLPLYVAAQTSILLQTSGATLSPWWHFESGGCRGAGGLVSTADFTGGPFACADFWNGQQVGGYFYETPAPSLLPNSARLRSVFALPTALAGPIDNSKIWYAHKVTIFNSKTVGTGACSGCLDGACIVVNQINLSQPAPAPDVIITTGPQQIVTYRGATGTVCLEATPTRRMTWGSIKSLYH